jgi:hypothetical protein
MDDTEVRKKRHKEREEYIRSKKRVPCADCGNTFPEVCMDFHHIDEETKHASLKNRSNPSMGSLMKKWSLKRINEELDKCVVLCACCHRIRHS